MSWATMRRRWHNPRILILAVSGLFGLWLLGAVFLAYWDRPRVRVGFGGIFVSTEVPGGRGINQDELIKRLQSPEFARQLEGATRRHWNLVHVVKDHPLSVHVLPWGERDLSVLCFVPRMYVVLGSRYTSVQWLQARLPLMPDLAELQADADEANADAKETVDAQVELVVAAMRHSLVAEWRETCRLIDRLRKRFEEAAFRAMEPSKGEIGIEVFGASRREEDEIADWVIMVKRERDIHIHSEVKIRFFTQEAPARQTSEYRL